MSIQLETKRIILREFTKKDLIEFHNLETNNLVIQFLTNYPKRTIEDSEDVLNSVIQQYTDHNTGRLALIEKETSKFIGWCGIKFNLELRNNHEKFHDLGYRILPEFWGKGYATEASKACLEFGFRDLKLKQLYAIVHSMNLSSVKVIQKIGFQLFETFHEHNTTKEWYVLQP